VSLEKDECALKFWKRKGFSSGNKDTKRSLFSLETFHSRFFFFLVVILLEMISIRGCGIQRPLPPFFFISLFLVLKNKMMMRKSVWLGKPQTSLSS